MKKVYICSPLRGDVARNQQRARAYCKAAIDKGYIPIAPHIYFTQFLNDDIPEDRERGMAAGLELLMDCAELWAYISDRGPSEGMKREIEIAYQNNITVKYIYI